MQQQFNIEQMRESSNVIPMSNYEINQTRPLTKQEADQEHLQTMLSVVNGLTDDMKAMLINALVSSMQPQQTTKTSNFEFPYMSEPNIKGERKPLVVWQNTQALMKQYKIKANYDVFMRDTTITDPNNLYHKSNLDGYALEIQTLAKTNGYNVTDDTTAKHIIHVSQLKENQINPVLSYLNECRNNWDGNSRIKMLVDTLITDDNEIDRNLKFELVKAWLISCAKLPSNTLDYSINSEGILVLQGKQGIGKTTFSDMIVPKHLKQYYADGVQLDVHDKDKVFEATCNWICELGELDGTLKREQASLKAFFTKKIDTQRRPYARKEVSFPRRTSFIGTVNDSEFLQDSTGDRRYWVIPIAGIDYATLSWLNESDEINQLWGEIKYLADTLPNGHKLDDHIKSMLNDNNASYRVMSNIQIKVQSHFDWLADKDQWQLIATSEIANRLDLKSSKGLRQAIEECGGEYKRTKSIRGYLVPPFKSVHNI